MGMGKYVVKYIKLVSMGFRIAVYAQGWVTGLGKKKTRKRISKVKYYKTVAFLKGVWCKEVSLLV